MVCALQAAALSGLVLAVGAHPHARSSEHQLHARQLTATIDRFRPRQRATYVAESGDVSTLSVSTSPGDYVQVAETHLRRVHPEAEFRRAGDNYVSGNGIGHVYFKQTLFGFDLDDADFNVNVSCAYLASRGRLTNKIVDRSNPMAVSSHTETLSILDYCQMLHQLLLR